MVLLKLINKQYWDTLFIKNEQSEGEMDRLQSMQTFVRVAELESFTKAAESLGLPKASISTHVQQLESLMGTRLLHRTTRKVQLTQDGMTYYERCKDLLSDMDQIESMFQKGPEYIAGRIRVDMPSGFAKNLLIPRMSEFVSKYPGVEIELSSTDRRVDVVREGFDCVLRVGNLVDSGLIAKKLGSLSITNCVSADYIKQFGKPKNLDDLSRHQLVHYVSNLGAKSEGFEYFDAVSGKYKNVKMKGPITVNNADAYVQSCLAGLGIIQAPSIGLKPYLLTGELVEVMTKFKAEPMPVALIYPHRRNLSRRVQVFMDWMTTLMKDYVQ